MPFLLWKEKTVYTCFFVRFLAGASQDYAHDISAAMRSKAYSQSPQKTEGTDVPALLSALRCGTKLFRTVLCRDCAALRLGHYDPSSDIALWGPTPRQLCITCCLMYQASQNNAAWNALVLSIFFAQNVEKKDSIACWIKLKNMRFFASKSTMSSFASTRGKFESLANYAVQNCVAKLSSSCDALPWLNRQGLTHALLMRLHATAW